MKIFSSSVIRSVTASLALLAGLPPPGNAAPSSAPVDRVDPPSWWVGMHNPTVQLMVHGPGAARLRATADYPGVRVTAQTTLTSANYLFVTLSIAPDAPAGTLDLRFTSSGRLVTTVPYRLDARREGSRSRRGYDARDAIYLVMPDRFANGDPGNDHPADTLDVLDRSRPGARHGGDLAGLMAHLDYVERMGFTQLWLTPVLENAQPAYSYHGYAITDHYRIDPRYGTNEDYRHLSEAARARQIGLIADVVINHIGSGHWWMKDLPAADWLSSPAGAPLTNHMHTTVQDPYAAEADRRWYLDGWFADVMPDLHPAAPELGTYLIQNAIWWLEYANLSGLRIDTYSYSDKDYMARYTRAIRDEYPNLNIVGEEWRNHPSLVAYWQAGKVNPDGYVSHLPSLMDFPTQGALITALTETRQGDLPLRSLYENLGEDFLYANPRNLVVFSENHDTNRTLHAVGDDVDLWWMAQVYVATIRGIPQFLYGSETLMTHPPKRTDDDPRLDFPGGWAGDPQDGFTGRGLPDAARSAQARLARLLTWRKTSCAISHGTLTHYVPVAGVYVYFREYRHETVMVLLNRADSARTVDLARFAGHVRPGAAGTDVVRDRPVRLGDALEVAAHSATVLDLTDPAAAERGACRLPLQPEPADD